MRHFLVAINLTEFEFNGRIDEQGKVEKIKINDVEKIVNLLAFLLGNPFNV